MSLLSLEAAQAWKAAGGPQHQFPQALWRKKRDGSWYCKQHVDSGGLAYDIWIAAPDHEDALMFLENEKGYHWERGQIEGGRPAIWWAWSDHDWTSGEHMIPNELILVVCADIAQTEKKNGH